MDSQMLSTEVSGYGRIHFDWQQLQLLIDARQYDVALGYLSTMQAQTVENELFLPVLAMIYQVCETCQQQEQMVSTYEEAYKQASANEVKLRQQLQQLLQSLANMELSLFPSLEEQSILIPENTAAERESEQKGQKKLPILWQHIKHFLKVDNRAEEFEDALGVTGQSPDLTGQNEPGLLHPPNVTGKARPFLSFYCLGTFQVYEDELLIDNWPSRKGRSILKYLVTHREHPVPKEVLMELFWPESDPDSARNNLNVAIYGLRQALRNGYPEFSHVLFQEDCYLLNPDMMVWVDIEEFEQRLKRANMLWQKEQPEQAVWESHAAESLYGGEFLADDRYEDWVLSRRQELQEAYIQLCTQLSDHYYGRQAYNACVTFCRKVLAIEPCQESTHRRLMQSYTRMGQAHLALRQYHLCETSLKCELDVQPEPETWRLYQDIRAGNGRTLTA